MAKFAARVPLRSFVRAVKIVTNCKFRATRRRFWRSCALKGWRCCTTMGVARSASRCHPGSPRGRSSSSPTTTASPCAACNGPTRPWRRFSTECSVISPRPCWGLFKRPPASRGLNNANLRRIPPRRASPARLSPVARAAWWAGPRHLGDCPYGPGTALAPPTILEPVFPQRDDLSLLLLRPIPSDLDRSPARRRLDPPWFRIADAHGQAQRRDGNPQEGAAPGRQRIHVPQLLLVRSPDRNDRAGAGRLDPRRERLPLWQHTVLLVQT